VTHNRLRRVLFVEGLESGPVRRFGVPGLHARRPPPFAVRIRFGGFPQYRQDWVFSLPDLRWSARSVPTARRGVVFELVIGRTSARLTCRHCLHNRSISTRPAVRFGPG